MSGAGGVLDVLVLCGGPLCAATSVEGSECELLDGVVVLGPHHARLAQHLGAVVLDGLRAVGLACMLKPALDEAHMPEEQSSRKAAALDPGLNLSHYARNEA